MEASQEKQSSEETLQLPWSEDRKDTIKLGLNEALSFDLLGPMIVNSDGSVSRITNWENMTDREKQVPKVTKLNLLPLR